MTMFTDPDGRHAFEFGRYEQQENGLALFQCLELDAPASAKSRSLTPAIAASAAGVSLEDDVRDGRSNGEGRRAQRRGHGRASQSSQ